MLRHPFFDALAGFHKAHPHVKVAVREGNSEELVDSLRRGGLDVILVGYANTASDDLDSLTIISEGLVGLLAN
ncbi:MAG: LysR substrate-binding domain-containing protein [Solirubrobacteraceae bacterium]